MQGTDKLHLVHQHMFHMATHREQLIITADIPSEDMAAYVNARKDNKDTTPFILTTDKKVNLQEILQKGTFTANIRKRGE